MKLVGIFLFLLVAIYWGLSRIPSARLVMDRVKSRIPIMGVLVVTGELAQFSRTISMLLDAGVPLARALPMGINGCSNLAIKSAFQDGEESLVNGQGLAIALRQHRVLPSIWVELVMIGEESNYLPQTMRELAESYQKDLESRLASILGILEPLSTFAVGGVVLFIALSMFMPLNSGYSTLGGG